MAILDKISGSIIFIGDIDDESGKAFVEALFEARELGLETVNIFINSGGGSVDMTRTMIDFMKMMSFKTKTIATGFVGSCAVDLFCSGDYIEILDGCEFLVHKPTYSTSDSFGANNVEYFNSSLKFNTERSLNNCSRGKPHIRDKFKKLFSKNSDVYLTYLEMKEILEIW